MTVYECCKFAITNQSAILIRHKDNYADGNQYDVKCWGQGNKHNWQFIDMFTAQAIITLYESLSGINQIKYMTLPLTKLVNVTWKMVS
jgi:hypothetical protein